jgi:hypothetical protein
VEYRGRRPPDHGAPRRQPAHAEARRQDQIQAHPLRDGRTGGSFITITLADGRVVTSVRPPQP